MGCRRKIEGSIIKDISGGPIAREKGYQKIMDNIVLDTLRKGLPTLTEGWGGFLSEAGLYCLESQGHKSGAKLTVKGTINRIFTIYWEGRLSKKMLYSWGDAEEAVEYGATCIAILLAISNTGYNTIERSYKGTGFDYWLGSADETYELPFQRKARLEISGIMNGDSKLVNRRAKEKVKQTDVSDKAGFPAYVIVVEFSRPMSKFIEK